MLHALKAFFLFIVCTHNLVFFTLLQYLGICATLPATMLASLASKMSPLGDQKQMNRWMHKTCSFTKRVERRQRKRSNWKHNLDEVLDTAKENLVLPHVLDKAPSAACVRLVVKKKLTIIPVQKIVPCAPLEFRQYSLCLPREKPKFTVSRTQCFHTKKKTRYLKSAYSNNNAPQLVLFYGSIKKIWRPRSQHGVKTFSSNDHSHVGLPVVAKRARDALGKEKKRTPLAHNHCRHSSLSPFLKTFPLGHVEAHGKVMFVFR